MHLVTGDLGEAGLEVAAVLSQFALDQPFHIGPIGGPQPTALHQQIGQGEILGAGPEGTGLDKVVARDRVRLQGENAEEQVAVRDHVPGGGGGRKAVWGIVELLRRRVQRRGQPG